MLLFKEVSMAAIQTPPDIDHLPACALLTRTQLALVLSSSVPTLKRWSRLGKGPIVTRIEGQVRFKVGDVKAWLEAENA